MKLLYKLLSIFLTSIIVISVIPLEIFGVDATTFYGSCGESTTWILDTSTGVLTINGTGKMNNYDSSNFPWYLRRKYIKSVVVGEDVVSIGDNSFSGCAGITSILIPNSVTLIGNYAFFNCTGLTSINIPDSVTLIGNYVFRDCIGLTSVTIGNSVASIGTGAFSGCTGLSSITIPDSVTLIGANAFMNCTGLECVTIGKSVTTLTLDAGIYHPFMHCTGLENIIVENDNQVYHSDGNCLIETNSATLIVGCKNSIIPADGSVISIGDFAFSDCIGLKSINIPDSVTSIGWCAFLSCTGLIDVIIPDSVIEIGSSAFRYCTNLNTIDIPDCVDTMGMYVFDDTAWHANQPDGLVYIGKMVYNYKGRPLSIAIKEGTLGIASYAFNDSESLTSIIIPDSVALVGNSAFFNCSNLKDVYYTGTAQQKTTIFIESHNSYLQSANWHYNYTPHTMGDINDDGKVNNKDLTRLFQYLSGWSVEINEIALDINGDGKVNNKDLTRLFQYLSGWDVEIF